jgi:phosphoribosylanthranilate isomerase
MNFTRIKVCGITTPKDARACYSLGVELLGVIFAESPRIVTPDRAREIREAVPRARLVGVFSDQDLDEVVDIVKFVGLDMIQLHGDEAPVYCHKLFSKTLRLLIKRLSNGQSDNGNVLDEYRTASYFLFDLDKRQPSGLGSTLALWREAARATRQGHSVFLAGGLDASNVRAAIHEVAPFCVDVCRGVEEAPGVKDIDKVAQFISEVRR